MQVLLQITITRKDCFKDLSKIISKAVKQQDLLYERNIIKDSKFNNDVKIEEQLFK
jgi:hypothetical protein